MSKKKKKAPQKQVNKAKKKTTDQPRDPRAATPNEILFFKIGMSVIGLAVIVIAIVLIVQYYVNKEDENPLADYVVITTDELSLLAGYDEESDTYGNPNVLKGDGYEEINSLFQANEYFYVYFYHSSDPNDEIANAIIDYTGNDGIPTMTLLEEAPDDSYYAFFLIDLDATVNAGLFDNTQLAYLGLDSEAENILVEFDSYNGSEFTVTIDIDDILETIINLQ